MIMLGADFTEDDDMPGYMEGAVRIANRKVNKCILPKLWAKFDLKPSKFI